MATQTRKPANLSVKGQAAISSSHLDDAFDNNIPLHPARARLSREEIRARMSAFEKDREEEFVAAVRKDEN